MSVVKLQPSANLGLITDIRVQDAVTAYVKDIGGSRPMCTIVSNLRRKLGEDVDYPSAVGLGGGEDQARQEYLKHYQSHCYTLHCKAYSSIVMREATSHD